MKTFCANFSGDLNNVTQCSDLPEQYLFSKLRVTILNKERLRFYVLFQKRLRFLSYLLRL